MLHSAAQLQAALAMRGLLGDVRHAAEGSQLRQPLRHRHVISASQPNHLQGSSGHRRGPSPSLCLAISDLSGLPGARLSRDVGDVELVPVAAGEEVQARSPADDLGARRERRPIREHDPVFTRRGGRARRRAR
jgi:hypothetical protein